MIEGHSIDFVPLSARYGTPRRLFTVWFSANMTVLGLAIGTFGVQSGLSFAATLIALFVGNAAGTFFMAAHSAQGPQLGVPQMIQSRAQFGVRGAALPLLAVAVTFVLYCAANDVLIEGVLGSLLPMGPQAALVLFSILTAVIAFVGYELIHKLGAILTLISIVLFAVAAYLLWSRHPQVSVFARSAGRFSGAAFLLTTSQAAAWSLSYGPYVADYSRYLSPTVPTAKTFWYTGLGCFLGSLAIMAFGAYFAYLEPQLAANPAEGVAQIFGPLHRLVQVLIVAGIVQGNVLNLYSAYMSTATIFGGLHGMQRMGRGTKLLILTVLVIAAAAIALATGDRFHEYFANALNAMLYVLVPWSAINLADYYFVRHGRYNIPALYDSAGEYGAYRWNTIAVYCVGIATQVPFFDLSFYQGPVARWLGADVAWIPGLLIPGILYVFIESRSIRRGSPNVASTVANPDGG